MNYTLIRSKRKTLALYIRDGSLEVRAPIDMPKKEIDSFIEEKRDWVEKKIATFDERSKQKSAFEVNYGSHIPYRGKDWIVKEVPGDYIFFDNAFCVPAHLTAEQVKDACVQIYRLIAKRDLIEKTVYYATQMNVEVSRVKINGAKRRWGSCSAKKSLNFSWRLIMANDEAIDYVVVHELAHIKEMNHSPKFWAIVESVLPDYKERKLRLEELQKRLSTEDWE